jgi:cyclopropane-fatty-acyl-phospholipid synthase
MLIPGTELTLAESYIYGAIDVEGNMESVFALADRILETTSDWKKKLGLVLDLMRFPKPSSYLRNRRGSARLAGHRHTVERDKEAVTYHYNVSNEFYQLFLDQKMVYSCAYFKTEEDELDEAQLQKLDYICRKLRLKPGQRLLDIGCGWGGLVLHAARHFGVDARGITLSRPQAELANRRIAEAGLDGRCRVDVVDYRELESDGGYDALVSVGMFEHVGEKMLPVFFSKAFELLKPGGVFMNHGIARNPKCAPKKGPDFTDVYVFPDGELVPINTTLRVAESSGFEVRDVESLREHYTMTLRKWVDNLEARHGDAVAITGETTYRIWRLYMAGSAYYFDTGKNNLYQTLLAKPRECGSCSLPLTRSDWY